ncbi:cell cycle control protein [Scheffersomyces xylosifermentans]|uniref:cell cycle control protein n=1 Tax=Scheffersomyces xylosifermentans TaxID=1304137 RepID=UPI00315D1254
MSVENDTNRDQISEEIVSGVKSKENAHDASGTIAKSENPSSIDYSDEKYQKDQWKALKRAIHKQIYTLEAHTVEKVVLDLFKLNLVRGRGLLVREIMKAELEDNRYTAVFASLIAVLNSKIPEIGELLVSRLVLQFRKNYKRNNKRICISSSVFICHLTNQRVVSEILILQMLQLLLEDPTDATIEIATRNLKVVGKYLNDKSAIANNMIYARLRDILHDNESISERSKSIIQELTKIRKSGFRYYPTIEKSLDLVDEEDKETHVIELGGQIESQEELNVFQFDEDYESNEKEYDQIRKEILDEEEEENVEPEKEEEKPVKVEIEDMTQADLLQYQKTVYLTVMSSMSSEEAVHKLLKLNFNQSKEDKLKNNAILADMIVKCCSQEKTYSKYYGVIGEKLCSTNKFWHSTFVKLFKQYYEVIDSLDTNALRNVGKFFGHLFASDKLAIDESWSDIRLTEADTNAASRIMLKFIFQEMIEELGTKEVKERLIHDDFIKEKINGVFPVVNVTWKDAEHLRFSINYFTAIGLGVLTEEMRDVLKDLPPPPPFEDEDRGRSRSRSIRSADDSRSRSYSRSYSRSRSGSYSRSRSSSYSRSRSVSYSRSRSRSYSRSRTPSRSRSRSRSRSVSYSRSPSPVNRNGEHVEHESRGDNVTRTPSREPLKRRKDDVESTHSGKRTRH